MKAVLIYAGTTEGRTLAMKLAEKGIPSEVCVATEYGRQVMQSMDHATNQNLIKVRQGRLLPEQMRTILMEGDYLAVVDATHPYATVVTDNVKKSLQGTSVPFFRLERDLRETPDLEKITIKRLCHYYASAEECAKSLRSGRGNLLLTTGSKELELFCQDEELRKRLVVRVLPGRESMELCWKCGLEGKQIIAMQGPFTKEMNLATIRQYGISGLVTKESGKLGGVDEKIEAALEAEIECHVIKPPVREAEKTYTFEEVLEGILSLTGKASDQPKMEDKVVSFSKDGAREKRDESNEREESGKEAALLDVVLAGIGPGSKEFRTAALEERLSKTDYLFGAKRMLENVTFSGKSYPYYQEKDILPCLKKIQKEAQGTAYVTILFSGDTGFYSGAERLCGALRELDGVKLHVLPGISSLSAFSAKLGESWQDAMIMSTHGTEKNLWKTEMLYGLRRGRKIFFLTSGPGDVREIAQLLRDYGYEEEYVIKLGYQLQYEDEKISELAVREALKTEKSGLYVGFLVVKDGEKDPGKTKETRLPRIEQITPGWDDEEFLREKVPMTKEEIREVSICKLKLKENAVVYDIGSGTGSIAMEIAALSPKLLVYAIECQEEAISLLKRNRERFGAFNVRIVEEMAPRGLKQLPAPTHAFIGGSKGNLKEILEALYEANSKARVVVNAVSLETITQMQTLLAELPVRDVEVTMVNVSKARQMGDHHLMQAGNPVMIFAFEFQSKEKTEGEKEGKEEEDT